MTFFGKLMAFGFLLVLALIVSGFIFLHPQNGSTPPGVPTLTQAPGSESANSQLEVSSPSNDVSKGVSLAVAPVTPALLPSQSQAALLYRSTGLDNPQSTTTFGSGSTVGAAFMPSAATGSAGGALQGNVTIPILMYHYVRVDTNPRDTLGRNLSVTPTLFAQQMQYLADHGYTTLTLHDVYCILTGAESLPVKPIALTFDDGYLDFYTNAWPILKEHNFVSTSYIITGFVGGAAYMSWSQIRQLDGTNMVDFGAHTVHHLDLQLLGTTRLWNEVDGSKLALEQHLGHPVTDFDYPSGEYNTRVIADVQKAGFNTAVTTHYGVIQNINLNFTLHRVRVTGPNGLRSWIASLP